MGHEDDGTLTRILGDDYSYISLLSVSGNDATIIEAARMSTDKGFQGWGDGVIRCVKCGLESGGFPDPTSTNYCMPGDHDMRASIGDERLLAYLWKNKHLTPFEMVQIRIEVQAPIFVFREWHRHRTQSYNELSARYTPLPDMHYIPSIERLHILPTASRQSQGLTTLTTLMPGKAAQFIDALAQHYADTQTLYTTALADGIPKELARIVLPVGRYSRMQASANLRNWLHFLELRLDEHAQYEIRQYAKALAALLREYVPRTMRLFEAEQDAKGHA